MITEYLDKWSYFAVFVLSALPWVESAIVAFFAVMLGMNPVVSGILAFLGNWLVVVLVVFLFDKLNVWRNRKKGGAMNEDTDSKKRKRAYHIFVKYGLPGLAVIGPLFIGTEIAAAFAMAFKAPRGAVMFWMTLALVFWTALACVAAYFGIDAVGFMRGTVS